MNIKIKPIRLAKFIFSRLLNLLPNSLRIKLSLTNRPAYSYCIYNAAILGKKLGLEAISVIEFGVASGDGLRFIEIYAKKIENLVGIKIEIYGFDNGDGLPKPIDYRDLPYHWKSGFFKMDKSSLKPLLNKSNLIIGNISDTSKNFFNKYSPAPVGAVFHDFDFYSSTKYALNMFSENQDKFLPRVFNYFDDTIGNEIELFSDFTGERLAINEFNNENEDVKFSPAYHLICKTIVLKWHYKIWISHFFKNKNYNSFISFENQQSLSPKEFKFKNI